MKDGVLLVLSGPSGVGKGSVLKELVKLEGFKLSVSATTREPREGETNEKDYYFIDRDEFLKNVENGNMLEYNEFCGNYYGTLKNKLEALLKYNRVVILEIDVNGAENVLKSLDCVRVFLLPPSFLELKKRLVNRGTETQMSLKRRLEKACFEIKNAYKYDYVVVNDELNSAVNKIKAIVQAESLHVKNKKYKIDEILKTVF